MKQEITARIRKAIDIFLDAINDGTLAKGQCTACAVGNLVAYGLNGKITKKDDGQFRCTKANHLWGLIFTSSGDIQLIDKSYFNNPHALKNIKATDFTLEELMEIEFAFENNTKINSVFYSRYTPEQIRTDQINGLAAVIKVMMAFDDVNQEIVKEAFVDRAELIPIA